MILHHLASVANMQWDGGFYSGPLLSEGDWFHALRRCPYLLYKMAQYSEYSQPYVFVVSPSTDTKGWLYCLMNPPSTAASQGLGKQNYSYKYGNTFTCWPPLAEAFFNFPVFSRQSVRGVTHWMLSSFYFWPCNWNDYYLRLWNLDSEHEAS